LYLSIIRLFYTGNQSEQCGFACPIYSYQPNAVLIAYAATDIFEELFFAILKG